MEQKEIYWSRFANDFEERNNYVIGKSDMDIILNEVSTQKALGKTLELACGNGTYSRILCKNAEALTATDFSDEMVKVATSRLKNFENVRVEKADAFDLKYPQNSFNTVFLANLLHIIPCPENVIEQVKKVLKPGGKIIVLDFGSEGMSIFNKIGMIHRYLKTYGKPPKNGTFLTTRSVANLLKIKGFSIEKTMLAGKKVKAAYIIATIKK